MQPAASQKLELVSRNEIFVAPADIQEFDAMQSALIREFAPATEFQRLCLKTLIQALWTLRRTRILEAFLLERAHAAGALDPILDPAAGKQMEKVLALRRQAQRDHNRALKDLKAAQREQPAPRQSTSARVIPFPAGETTDGETTYELVEEQLSEEHNAGAPVDAAVDRDDAPSCRANRATIEREADPASAA